MFRWLLPKFSVQLCAGWGCELRNEFTAMIERDGEWFVAYCPEIPEANGQGRTQEEAQESLADGIALILEYRRDEALRDAPVDGVKSVVVVNS